MRANPIRSLTLLAAMTIVALVSMPSAAQDFPTRPVRFIVPYAAGGSGDLLARLLGNKLAAIWGQQVVVDNRAGGGGLIGTEFAARSDPDGYALYLATDGPLTVAASGFHVVVDHTMDVVFKRLQDITPAQIATTTREVLASAPSADGVYIPCNQWSAADAAPLIESALGIPVVTGAHADYWEAFRSVGIHDRIAGHGRLMLSLSEEAAPAMAARA